MTAITIYHGCPSRPDLSQCRDVAPSFEHGCQWLPQKMTPIDAPFILDNGAFAAFKNSEPWDATAFVRRTGELPEMPLEPTFVVLPDVVTDAEATRQRASAWASVLDWPLAYPCQDGMAPESAVETALDIGADWLFIGGTESWKRRQASEFVDAAHDHGLSCHIGRPGRLRWAIQTDADSIDTTSIVRNESWDRLAKLEAGQQTLEA